MSEATKYLLDVKNKELANQATTITRLKREKAELWNELKNTHGMLVAVYEVMESDGAGLLQRINKSDTILTKHDADGGGG